MKVFKITYYLFLLFLASSLFAQDSFLSSTLLEPSISYQNWQGSASSRNGVNAKLRSLYRLGAIGVGLDAEYGIFKEKFDDQRLGQTDWRQLILGLSTHLFIGGHNFSIGYAPYHKLSTDNTRQYISSQTVRSFNDYALKGTSIDFQWSFPLSAMVAGHIRLLRSTYDEQNISEQTFPFNERTINSLFVGVSLPFRLGL